jgi:hypothetical protein
VGPGARLRDSVGSLDQLDSVTACANNDHLAMRELSYGEFESVRNASRSCILDVQDAPLHC